MTRGLFLKRANWNHGMAWTAVFAIFGTGSVRAETNAWTSIGPQGGEIRALSVDPHHPGTLYAATQNGGAFKSTNGSDRWVKSGMPNKPLVFDPQDPDTIYAIDYSAERISKSTDGGTSWNPANSGLPDSGYPLVLAIDPLKPSTLYAGTTQGIFKSMDGGTNWSPASSGLPLYYPFPDRQPGPGDGCAATPSRCQPRPPEVYSLVIDPQNPSTLYAVADGVSVLSGTGLTVYAVGGIVKSTDGGGSWNTVDLGLPQSHSIHARLAIDPQNPSTLYVGTVYGIFKSTDGGAGWSPVNSGLPPVATGLPPFPNGAPYFDSVVVDPQQPATVYATITDSSGGRLFKTANGGARWSEAASGLPEGIFVSSLQIDLQSPTTLYAGTRVGVFKSTDGGASWAPANSGLTATLISDVAIDPRNANTLYAATSIGLVKTTDGGTNWSPANSNVASSSFTLAIDPQNSSTVFAPGCTAAGSGVPDCGVFKSTDGGTSWSASWISAMAIDPQDPDTVYAIETDTGVFKTTDAGASWTAVYSEPITPRGLTVLRVDPQNSGTMYAGTPVGVFKTTDAGANWTAVNAGLPSDTNGHLTIAALAIDPQTPSTIYALYVVTSADVGFWVGGGVFKSADGGVNWTRLNTPGGSDWLTDLTSGLAIDPQNPSIVYAGNMYGVIKTTDGGASWRWVNSGFPVSNGFILPNQNVPVTTLAIDPRNPGTVYAGSFLFPGSAVFKTTNGGANWTAVNSGLTGFYDAEILAIDGQNPSTVYAKAVVAGSDGPSGGWLFKTTNGGASWTAVNSGLPNNVTALAIDPQNSSMVYAGTGSGVFRSSDAGTNWVAVNSGLTTLSVTTLAIDSQSPGTVYAGASDGSVFAITFALEP